jgi:hypothetical protein
MPVTDGTCIGARGQLLECEIADGLEQLEAIVGSPDHAAVDECGQRVDLGVADGFRGLERESAGEYGQPREQRPLALLQQVVAPLQRVPQRLLALRQVARAAASSIASGKPSRRTQSSATAAALSFVTTKPGCADCARRAKSRAAAQGARSSGDATRRGSGSPSGGTGNTCSPTMRSGSSPAA